MQAGIKLPQFGANANADEMRRWAVFAETVGYHFVLTGDHIALTPEVQLDYPAPYYEPFTTMAWLAGLTSSIRLGFTVIVVPYRHPAQLAHMGATLDDLSGGRLIFGVGSGWAGSEFDALGVPFEARGRMTDEYLAAVIELWTNENASFDGEFVSFKDVTTSPGPVQKPYPPIWVGGSSTAAMRRSVKFGDAWHPIGARVDWLRDRGLPRLTRIAEEAGRATPSLAPRIYCRLTDSPIPDDQRVAGEGTLDQVKRDIHELQELGATHVHLDTKRNSLTADSTRHRDEAFTALSVLAEKVFDLESEGLR